VPLPTDAVCPPDPHRLPGAVYSGTRRDEGAISQLKELNGYVAVHVLAEAAITEEVLG
jgi:hypothetical protein